MAVIKPFAAWRYASNLEATQIFSPLFDDQELLLPYYAEPYNAVHISYPQNIETVGATLADWKRTNVLKRDPLPALYPYYQSFSLFGSNRIFERKGFICMIRLDAADIILHENTVKSALDSRLRLLENSLLNATPTHGLYQDPEGQIESLTDLYMQAPLFDIVDAQGVRNKLGMIQNKEDILNVLHFMRQRPVWLADGHHRLEISFRHCAQETDGSSNAAAGWHLMYLSNMSLNEQPILPTHRLIDLPDNFSSDDFISALSETFWIERADSRLPIFQELQGQKQAFGIILPGQKFIARLRSEFAAPQNIPLELPDSVKSLDYTILHYFILDKILRIPYAEQPFSERLRYSHEYTNALTWPEAGANRMAVIVNGVHLDDMLRVCADRAIMPQKSTYFYPKVLNGALFGSIAENDNNSPFDRYFLPNISNNSERKSVS